MTKNIFLKSIIIALAFLTQHTITHADLKEDAQRLHKDGHFVQAINSYREAFKNNPHDSDILYSLAYCYLTTNQYKKAQKVYELLHRILPDNPNVLCFLGVSLKRQNKMHEAIATYQKAIKMIQAQPTNDTRHITYARAQRGISGAYLALGDLKNGFRAHEYRWLHPPDYIQELKGYVTDNYDLKNKRILLKTEYGLGDTLQFIRYAQVLKQRGAYIMVESQPELIPLLKNCWYIDALFPANSASPEYDFCTLLMSMPFIMQNTLETIPAPPAYLFADYHLITYWQQQLAHDNNIKIGLCWQGNTYAESSDLLVQNDAKTKSIPIDILASLAEVKHVSFYSLQKVNGTGQPQNIPDNFIIHHFENMDTTNGRFMDTAALIQNLDIVITTDTSIAHLAGGLGKPVWLLLPYNTDWRWFLEQTDSPWYPTMRLFRQPEPGDWHAIMQNVIQSLKK